MISLINSQDVLQETAGVCRARRLALGWRQEDLAKRSGVGVATLRRFERSGAIGFELLARVLVSLGIADSFLNAMKPSGPQAVASVEEFLSGAQPIHQRKRAPRAEKRE